MPSSQATMPASPRPARRCLTSGETQRTALIILVSPRCFSSRNFVSSVQVDEWTQSDGDELTGERAGWLGPSFLPECETFALIINAHAHARARAHCPRAWFQGLVSAAKPGITLQQHPSVRGQQRGTCDGLQYAKEDPRSSQVMHCASAPVPSMPARRAVLFKPWVPHSKSLC